MTRNVTKTRKNAPFPSKVVEKRQFRTFPLRPNPQATIPSCVPSHQGLRLLSPRGRSKSPAKP
jgi:hypothetical protein